MQTSIFTGDSFYVKIHFYTKFNIAFFTIFLWNSLISSNL